MNPPPSPRWSPTSPRRSPPSPRSHCGFLLPSSLSASSSSGLSGGSDWLFFTRPPQPQPRHVHVAACYFHGCVRQTPKGLGCAGKPPIFSSRDRIFKRLYTVGPMSAIRSLLHLKICFFGTMLPTLWDSQIRVLGPEEKRKYLNHPFLAYFGHFSGSLRLILTQPTSHWSYIMPMGSHTSVGTFSAAHHWDERVSEASDLVIFTRFKNA